MSWTRQRHYAQDCTIEHADTQCTTNKCTHLEIFIQETGHNISVQLLHTPIIASRFKNRFILESEEDKLVKVPQRCTTFCSGRVNEASARS